MTKKFDKEYVSTTQKDGDQKVVHKSWYRGEHCNFAPKNKKELRVEPDGLKKYILNGWLPEKPFITKQHQITAFGSCFAAHISKYLEANGYNTGGKCKSHVITFKAGIVNTFAIRQQFEWA